MVDAKLVASESIQPVAFRQTIFVVTHQTEVDKREQTDGDRDKKYEGNQKSSQTSGRNNHDPEPPGFLEQCRISLHEAVKNVRQAK